MGSRVRVLFHRSSPVNILACYLRLQQTEWSMDEDEDWQPDFSQETILRKTVVRFCDKHIDQNLEKFNSQPDSFQKGTNSDEEPCQEADNMMFEAAGLQQKAATETLYDPLKDERHEAWTHNHLNQGKYRKPLSCPGCFTPVCYDYEDHPLHQGQLYSPSIHNCQINYSRMIEGGSASETAPRLVPDALQKLPAEELNQLQVALQQQQSSYNMYFPVHCRECNHQLAMYDVDRKTYHLYSVV